SATRSRRSTLKETPSKSGEPASSLRRFDAIRTAMKPDCSLAPARARKEAPGLTFRTPFASWVADAGRASPEQGKVDTVGPDAEHGHRTAFDRHDPDALDGRRPEGERRPPGNGDGACPARLPALHGDDAPLAFEPALGGPRPLRPERRPRL